MNIGVFGGYSNRTGFKIIVWHNFFNFVILKSSNFQEEEKIREDVLKRSFWIYLIIYWLGLCLYLFFNFNSLLKIKPLSLLALILFLIGWNKFIAYLLLPFLMDSDAKRWHMTEHKVISFMEKGYKEPDREKLKSVFAFVWLCSSIALAKESLKGLTVILFSLIILNIFSFWATVLIIVSYPIFCLLFFFCYEYLTFKKPTDEMLDEGVRVIKEYYQKYGNLFDGLNKEERNE